MVPMIHQLIVSSKPLLSFAAMGASVAEARHPVLYSTTCSWRTPRQNCAGFARRVQERTIATQKRTLGVLLGALLVLAIGSLGCSASQLMARRPSATVIRTRTPRPTWTPILGSVRVATPTLDTTRFPGVAFPTEPPPTPQQLVPGSGQTLLVPQPAPGGPAVQTLVVIIVTATPVPPPTGTPLPPTGTPPATDTPGPPTATATITPTPLPPVLVHISVDKANVRQGPGEAYPSVTRLDTGTTVTVVGRDRTGKWWKICCVNGADVWISSSVVTADGPIWLVDEVANIPPPPPVPPTPAPTSTPAPTPTYAWMFRLEGPVESFPLGQNYFKALGVIYNGATPLYGYKLRIRKLSTGQEWLSTGSKSAGWDWEPIEWPTDNPVLEPSVDCPYPKTGVQCRKYNVKWDGAFNHIPLDDDVWEVAVTDGAGNPLSAPVRINTTMKDSKWYNLVFTSRG